MPLPNHMSAEAVSLKGGGEQRKVGGDAVVVGVCGAGRFEPAGGGGGGLLSAKAIFPMTRQARTAAVVLRLEAGSQRSRHLGC